MSDISDVFHKSLSTVSGMIDDGEYDKAGQILSNLRALAIQLEYRQELFICDVIDGAVFELFQHTREHNVPELELAVVNQDFGGYIAIVSEAYSKQESYTKVLISAVYDIASFVFRGRYQHPKQNTNT